jgi:hypothetical protein
MEAARLSVLETVRCLDCGEVYAKPVEGGTTNKNPGCPVCSYVGWIPINLPGEPHTSRRFASGRHRAPLAPPR